MNNKNNQQKYVRDSFLFTSWHLLARPKFCAPVLPTSGDNFQEEKKKKIGQSDFCLIYILLYVTFPWSYSLS